MKGSIKSCDWFACGSSFEKKNKKHRFCSDKCRKKNNRASKGQPLVPDFISGKKVDYTEAIKQIGQINNRPQQFQMVKVPKRTNYRYGLALGGFLLGQMNQQDKFVSALFGGLGYLLGDSIDKSNEDKIVYLHQPIIPESTIKNIPTPTPPVKTEPKRIMSGSDYMRANIDSLGLKGKYNYLMGDPSKDFYMLVTGSPGNGKSTFAIQFGQYFKENHGKVLYLASEQSGLNKPFQNLLKKYDATFDINTMPTNKVKEIIKDSKNYDLLIIDSVNNLRLFPDDIRQIKEANNGLAVVAIMQSTKDGKFKGSQEFLHDCDIRIDCKRPKAYQTKSRFAPPSDIAVMG